MTRQPAWTDTHGLTHYRDAYGQVGHHKPGLTCGCGPQMVPQTDSQGSDGGREGSGDERVAERRQWIESTSVGGDYGIAGDFRAELWTEPDATDDARKAREAAVSAPQTARDAQGGSVVTDAARGRETANPAPMVGLYGAEWWAGEGA